MNMFLIVQCYLSSHYTFNVYSQLSLSVLFVDWHQEASRLDVDFFNDILSTAQTDVTLQYVQI
jgi:hypothetical protein